MKLYLVLAALAGALLWATITIGEKNQIIKTLKEASKEIETAKEEIKEVTQEFSDLDEEKFELRCAARCGDAAKLNPISPTPKREIVEIVQWRDKLVPVEKEVLVPVPMVVEVPRPLNPEIAATALNIMWKSWCIGQRHVPERCAPYRQ